MAKKSIFIGSAAESREAAATIARALADAGYEPLRWWQEFPPGSITMDRLLEITKVVDGAVFLFTNADKTWYRGEFGGSPRDNVVLEFGRFVTAIGRHRTLILHESQARLPSDMAAITYEKIIEDTATVAERTVQHFTRQFAPSLPPPLECISLVADPAVVEQQLREHPPYGWQQRLLYLGEEGARRWLAVVNEPSYIPQEEQIAESHLLDEAVNLVEVRTFTSLGPGDAKSDIEIAITLRNKEAMLQYIPVDISNGLLELAISRLGQHVRVPIGILGDFEERLNFIGRQLQVYGTRPMLYALLGNTLANLDRYELKFLGALHHLMADSDYLLLDASLAGPKWSIDVDTRGRHDAYTAATRQFLVGGVARRTGEPIESLVAKFEERIKFVKGGSDVPGTSAINVVESPSGRLVCAIRRYTFDDLISWLESRLHFKIVWKSSVFFNDVLGFGVILAKRA